ncbi:hypothetical protein K239x_16470 [Planctomycetes bacterium K23_9]|uniref:Uncharacterized protein n=1 Tax=Stieleria marina TaxID=1930275 RepID=A0A517NRE8_9BACT|nr:hypothetical protein K239x_16470 [Planctomycetes bacterium K23_9]
MPKLVVDFAVKSGPSDGSPTKSRPPPDDSPAYRHLNVIADTLFDNQDAQFRRLIGLSPESQQNPSQRVVWRLGATIKLETRGKLESRGKLAVCRWGRF